MSSDQNPVAPTSQRQPPPRSRDADTEMPDAESPQQQQQQQHPPSSTPQSHPQSQQQPASTPRNPPPAEPHPSSTPPPEEQQRQRAEPDQPPVALVPGPRAARLQELFASTAKHTLDKISKENFAACFPTIAAKAPGTLEFVQRQMVERLGGLWKKEFEAIMVNRQVVARLNELETLVADAAKRRREAEDPSNPPVAPHTLPPATILSAHLRPHLASHSTRLTTSLEATQSSNAQLWAEIQAQRAEMEALLASVEKVVKDIDGANAVLGEVVDDIAEETRRAERDIRNVGGGSGVAGGR
ncbi:hypothetical protein VTI74DRAFT_7713 [Chaetomium olivicolor]